MVGESSLLAVFRVMVTCSFLSQRILGGSFAESSCSLSQSRSAVAHGGQVQVAGGRCAGSPKHFGLGIPGGYVRLVWSTTGKEHRAGFFCQHSIPAAFQNHERLLLFFDCFMWRMFSCKTAASWNQEYVTALLVVPHQGLSLQTGSPTNSSHRSVSPLMLGRLSPQQKRSVLP